MDFIEKINAVILGYKENGNSVKKISDGNHTFEDYINMRNNLFIALCNAYPDISWKAKRHFDEENDPMFNGDFIAGIDTPEGTISFHLKLEYWEQLNVQEISNSPKYDGYGKDDVYKRIKSLNRK